MGKVRAAVAAALVLTATIVATGVPSADAATIIAAPDPLGALGPLNAHSQATAINDSGLIVGRAWLEASYIPGFVFDPTKHTMRSLGLIEYSHVSGATAINEGGTIVGWSGESDFNPRMLPVRWGPQPSRQSLGSLGGQFGMALGINDAGVIVGQSSLEGDAVRHAFVWDPATLVMTDIGVLPGGGSSAAYGVDDDGLVVGASEVGGSGPCLDGSTATCPLTHAFTYDVHTRALTDLGALPGGSSSEARGINSDGTVVGTSLVAGTAGSHPFTYDLATRTFTDLGGISGTTAVQARAINDDGVVVGTGAAGSDATFGWVYDPGTRRIAKATGISTLQGINDHGMAVGSGVVPTGVDADGNALPGTVIGAIRTQITLPPHAPTLLRADACAGPVDLSWAPPAFTGYSPDTYVLYRDGVVIATTPLTAVRDNHGHPGASYAVAARNAAGTSPRTPVLTAVCANSISGTVTSGGAAVAAIDVRIYPAGGSSLVAKTTTAADGTYFVTGLATGSYQVRFSSSTPTFVTQWDGAAPTQAAAPPLVVSSTDGAIADADLVASGAIDGTVTAGSVPLAGIDVRAYRSGTGTALGKAVTDADGTYHIAGLAPGPYQLRFSSSSGVYIQQWNGGSASQVGAPSITVASRTTATVDAALQAAGRITGHYFFIEASGLPGGSAGVEVRAYPIGQSASAKTTTGADGGFVLSGLAPGSYQVRLNDPFGRFGGAFWYHLDNARNVTRSPAVADILVLVGGTVITLANVFPN